MGDRNLLERILSGEEKPTNLALPLLQEITENFSEKRKIGKGGFGEVYKGVLENKIVAVKRITVSEHTIDGKLFDQEVKNLMEIIISHRNVVRFLGFCSNTHREVTKFPGSAEYVFINKIERLLCFEYISNRSLDKHITDELRGLEWSIRYKIINGICHGLHYLHEENNIIHMDLKPGNIMLDDDMVPKITDFGLSRLDKNTHTSGTRFITQGYCAPEYENCGKTSKKADMYSLGLTIIELVTGRKGEPDNVNVLRRWRHRWNNSPKHSLASQCQQVTTCLDIAALCRKKEAADRPTILDIIGILSKTDTTNEHTDHANPYSDDDMLGIEPLELRFPLKLQKQLPSKVKLTNKTKHYYAFNIKTPSRQYHTEPNKGIVSPQSKCIVQITMQTQETALLGMWSTGDFIVQSTKVNIDLRAEDITEHAFKEPREVDEVNLTVVVYEPGEPKGDLKGQEDTKKRKMTAESTLSKDKPGISATRQVEEIPMDINPTSYKYTLGQCIEQLERISFRTTPSISCNQQTNMSDRAVDLATGAMGSLRHKLGDLLKGEHNLGMNMEDEIESLSEELRDMQLALHKVSQVHRNYLDDQVKHWADNVREMSYDIEDVVDGLPLHIEHSSDMDFFMGLIQKMSKLFTWGKTHNPTEDLIKHIQKRVQGLADRRKRCKVDEVVANLNAAVTIDPRISNIYKYQNQLVGLKEPISVLIRWLSDKDGDGDVSKQQLKFVSIVGFGGLGKTTLAKAVYDKLQSKFSHRAFIPVGRNPNVKKVFYSILHGFGYDSNAENLNEMQLIDKIRGLLKKNRYFIVIDDIWDSSAWDIIKCAFIENNCGSSVVTTTRIHSVADDCCIPNRGYVHEMKPLNDKDSRKLFASRIFGSQEAWDNVPDEILNDILKKCGGLPLAIISIASLLAHNERSRWHSIRNSLVSMFEENHGDLKYMEQVLDLSYTHLPHRLKTCLLDIGKYQEDVEIKKKDLLRQWTAQGFVSASRLRDAEDVAEDYFCELINMSMIQPGKRDYNDEVLSCRVHDIMLDLIRSKAAEENFNLVIDGPKVVIGEHRRVRRVTIHYNGEEDGEILEAINGSSMSHVRSVLLFRGSLVPSFLVLKYIRVLFIKDLRCEGLDLSGICGLFLLRYLKIYCSEDLSLPCQIGELRQLETIEVKPWVATLDGPICLPSDIVTLTRLSHLSFSRDVVLPDGIGRLKSLRTLRLPHIDFLKSSVDDIKGLGELTNLRELEMASGYFCQDNDVNMRIDALRSSIGKLSSSLSTLSMGSRSSVDVDNWRSTLTPPCRLQKLELYRWEFQRIPRWVAQLKYLNSLTLVVREVADGVSIAAGLRFLAYLDLSTSMGDETEERVIVSGTGFGMLKYLNWECPYASLVFQPGALPRLEEVRICFRPSMSDEFLPVGSKHLPVGTLRTIRLVVSDYFEGHDDDDYKKKLAARRLLRRAFRPHRRAAVITVEFYSDE